MKKKFSAALMAIAMLINIMTSVYLMPMQALAEGTTESTSTDSAATKGKTAEEIAQEKAAIEEATVKVNDLFQDDNQEVIRENLVLANISSVEPFVNNLADGTEKTALQDLLSKAKQQVADVELAQTTEKAQTTVKKVIDGDKTTVSEEPKTTSKKKLTAKEATPVVGKQIEGAITKVVATINNNVLTADNKNVKIGDTVKLEFSFELKANHDYNDGDYIKYKLPTDIFNATELTNKALTINGSGDPIGTYSVKNGEVIINFMHIRESDSGIAIPIENGKFNASGTLKATNDMNPDTELVFGENTTGEQEFKIPIMFIPKVEGKKLIEKSDGKIDSKTGNITWTITANENLTALEKTIVQDDLATQLEFVGDVQVQKYKVQLDGSLVAEGNPEDQKPESNKKFAYAIDPNFAYKFTVVTKNISDADTSTETINNTATITTANNKTESSSGKVVVSYGTPLEKKIVSQNQDEIKWEVDINYNQKTLSRDVAKYTDNFTGEHDIIGTPKLEAVDSTGKTMGDENIELNNLSLDTDKKGFTLDFENGIKGQAYKLTYTTQLSDKSGYLIKDLTIDNTIKRVDGQKSSTVKSNKFPQNIISKSNTIDYSNNKINWTIVINKDDKEMKAVTLTDIYPANRTLSEVQDFKVNGETKLCTAGTDKNGFEYNLGDIKSKQIITYSTMYDSKNVGNGAITNSAKLDFKRNSGEALDKNEQNSAIVNAKQSVDNGYKSGSYDYDKREINWEVGFNYQGNEIKGNVFTDTLGNNQIIDGTTPIELQKVDFSNNNDIDGKATKVSNIADIGTLNISDDNDSFTFTFNKDISNKNAYKFVYKTKDTDNIMEKEYKNTAILFDGTTNVFNQQKSVAVNHTENIIKKEAPNVSDDGQLLTWKIVINQGQSTLTNATITDMPGENQMILPKTFKIKELKMFANGFSENKVVFDSSLNGFDTEENDFKVSKTASGFVIKFPTSITKAYVIEYGAYYNGSSGSTTTNVATLKTKELGENKGGENTSGNAVEHSIIVTDFSGSASTTKVNFNIHKVDADTGLAIPGVKFAIFNPKGTFKLGEGETDENGDLRFYDLYAGTYKLQEISAPAPYDVNQSEYVNQKDINLDSSDAGLSGFINKTIENVTFGKCDAFEAKFVGNDSYNDQEEFQLFKVDSDKKETLVKDQIKIGTDGKLTNLPATLEKKTNYILKQVNDELPKFEVSFKTDAKGCTTTLTISLACPSFTISVEGLEQLSAEFAQKAKFTLTNKKNPSIKYENLTIDANKQISISKEVLHGDYELTQSNNIIGYSKMKNYDISVSKENCETGLKISIDPEVIACSSYYIEVVGVDAEFVAEARFELVDKNNDIATSGTNSLNELSIDKYGKLMDKAGQVVGSEALPLSEGSYTLKSTITPVGYTPISETVVPNETGCKAIVTIDLSKNACQDYAIQVKSEHALSKEDYEKYRANSEFKLVTKDGSKEFKELTIGEDSKLYYVDKNTNTKKLLNKKELVKIEKYKLVQTKTTAGFNTIPETSVKDTNNCLAELTIDFAKTTDSTPGISCPDFHVIFEGPANTKATFKLTQIKEVDGTSIDKVIATNIKVIEVAGEFVLDVKDASGVQVKALELGEYKLTQISNNAGYENAKDVNFIFDGTNCDQIIKVTSNIACPAVALVVQNAGQAIEGVDVTITDKSTGSKVFVGKTNQDGKITTTYYNLEDTNAYSVEIYKVGFGTVTLPTVSLNDCQVIINLSQNACPDYAISVKDENGDVLSDSSYSKFIADSEFVLKDAAGKTVEWTDGNDTVSTVKINAKGILVDSKGNTIDKQKLNGALSIYTLEQTKVAAGYIAIAPTLVQDTNNCMGELTINFAKTTVPTTPGISCPEFTINFNGPANTTAEFKLVKVDPKDASKNTDVATDIKVTTDKVTGKQSLVINDENGDVITALEEGSYKLVQTKSQGGYYAIAPTTIEVKMGVCIAEITIVNSPIPPACHQDTVVTITDTDGNKVMVNEEVIVIIDGKEIKVTIEDGKVVIPLESFNTNGNTTVIITLEDGRTSTVDIPSVRNHCEVEAIVPISKVCEQDKIITITDKDGKEVIPTTTVKVTIDGKEVKVTVADGKIVLSKESVPTNVNSEIKVLLEDGREATITVPKFSENCNLALVVEVDKSCKDFTVLVTENGEKIKSTKDTLVEIIDANGKTVASKTADAKGKVTFEGKYASSDYQVKVTIGKVVKTTTIIVNDQCSISVDVKTNACEKATIQVTINDEPAKGAILNILDADKQVVSKATTDNNGITTYKVKYVNDKYKAYVSYKGKKKDIVLIDCVTTVKFTTKTNVGGETEEPKNPGDSGTPITPSKPSTNGGKGDPTNTNTGTVKVPSTETPGHHYDLYDDQGKLIEKNVVVGKDGKINLDKLDEGDYTLVSKGGGKTINFSVNKDGKLPQTGEDVLLPGIIGLAMFAIGAFVIIRNRRKIA